MLVRLIMAILFTWLSSKPAVAYFSHSAKVDGLEYKVYAHIDPGCALPLEVEKLEVLRQQLEASPLPESRIFQGCFTALFDVTVEKGGTYSFIHNGYVQRVLLRDANQATDVPLIYENDAIVADLDLPPGRYQIFSHGKGLGPLSANQWGLGNAPYVVRPSTQYHRASFLVGAVRGICVGVLGIMALFFLFMTRENNRVFLIYGTFILINLLFIESMRSLIAELFGFRSGQHHFAHWTLFSQSMGALTQLSLGVFFGAFYEVRRNYPRLYRFFLTIYALIVLEFAVILFRVPYGNYYMSFIILLGTVTMMSIAVWFSVRRGGLYHLMLLGYGVMLTCTQYFVLSALGVIRVESVWGRDVHLIGSTMEVILFSIATSLKLNNKFAQQKKENDHVLEQLQKIVYPHQLEKIREGRTLEETMPTGKAEACVLAFDIIASSRIQHEKVKDFIEQAIELCVSTMYDRYDAKRLAADAYRIKVLGDGFLCSIGFPFPIPDGGSIDEAAVRLALRMVATFRQVVKEFNYHEPIYCAIGLAHGSIEAYYPMIGTKEYDLYGPAIILATRYEQLRKQLFSPEEAHCIILQERVYERLTPELQAAFSCIDLKSRQLRVRDDDHAQRVYVWQSSDASSNTGAA
ncbi:MAG TPA: 7TM diverse intracellular signaling domain-containing protein [Oligoflexus sp.]|uniref:7TM diverse intracellular signaling domain-containing protein n=1 Tax=Oligoflexus sp. TaxID=1971216 RepID=UPI002D7F4E94|nr:7TM diverse intracellular signaling domain-containing protein [Oligoflexus sp.]HET9240824.1 7TM diverse intracellular signaling domain-containing protein [Oligoflexus sp.]